MNINKTLDTLLTSTAGIAGVELVSNLQEFQDIYGLFVQSLIATAAIGRLTYDIVYRKKDR
jgi:hypothetical protein